MFSHIMVGSNDIARSKTFYDAVFAAMGADPVIVDDVKKRLIYRKDGAAFIEVASCYGCGACAAECPGKAITLQHFTDAQILAKEKAAFN